MYNLNQMAPQVTCFSVTSIAIVFFSGHQSGKGGYLGKFPPAQERFHGAQHSGPPCGQKNCKTNSTSVCHKKGEAHILSVSTMQ